MKAMKCVLPLSLALVCGSAVAGNTSEASKPEFDKLDVNGDDRISKQEAREHAELESNFDKLDRNDNARLSRNEYRRFGDSS